MKKLMAQQPDIIQMTISSQNHSMILDREQLTSISSAMTFFSVSILAACSCFCKSDITLRNWATSSSFEINAAYQKQQNGDD